VLLLTNCLIPGSSGPGNGQVAPARIGRTLLF